jgi:hypothetical protein
VSRFPAKSFRCDIVSETVSIALRRRPTLGERGKLFVHCSELDCQHVDTNEPPCPLTLDVFESEMRDRMLSA